MSSEASAYALEALCHLMVGVQLGRQMKSYSGNTLTFADGESIYSEMVIWTAGVTAATFNTTGTPFSLGHGGRILVDEFNRAIGLGDDIMAIGDISLHATSDNPPRMSAVGTSSHTASPYTCPQPQPSFLAPHIQIS